MVLVSWQSSALQMARFRRGAPQTPAGSRITRMRLIGLRRGASHDLSSIGNHLKEIGVIAVTPPLRMSIGSEVLARSPKSAAIRRMC